MFNVLETLFFLFKIHLLYLFNSSSIGGGLCRWDVGTFLSEAQLVPNSDLIKITIIDILFMAVEKNILNYIDIEDIIEIKVVVSCKNWI